MTDDIYKNFIRFRTGDVVLSAGENIGDIMIFIGRHSTIQHSCIVVWLDKNSLIEKKVKVHPYFIDENTTVLSFLGLAEGRKLDILTDELQKGLILYHPEELLVNAPIIYVRALNRTHIVDEYIVKKMEEYIGIHHLKLQYAYGKGHIITVGLGFDVFGKHPSGVLCSENVHMFLNFICQYPEFKVEDILSSEISIKNGGEKTYKNIKYEEYKVPDTIERMYVPDFFSGEYNTHPVFDGEEVRIIGSKSEDDITVKHPYFVVFVVLFSIILFLFFIINNYCESCRATGFCRVGSKDFFDLL